MSHKYQLEKYGKKFQCPSCCKSTFLKFIECDTNLYLEQSVFTCGRDGKCGCYKAQNGNTSNISSVCNTNVIQKTNHNYNGIGIYGRNHKENNFVQYSLSHFTPKGVSQATKNYFSGTSNHWNRAMVFWQVDHNMNVWAGKTMYYDEIIKILTQNKRA
jgi:hypothetical protein